MFATGLCLTIALAGGLIAESKAVQITFGPFGEAEPIPSPDGKWLVFLYFHADPPNNPQIWIMPAQGDYSQARPLVNDENYNAEVAWSPDSKWISYQTLAAASHGKSVQLFKVNVYTGEKVQLTHLPMDNGPAPGDSTSWSADGKIAFEMNGDVYEVDEKGGDAKKVIEIESRYPVGDLSLVRWSPDGMKLCFVAKNSPPHDYRTYIWIADVKANKAWRLTEGDFPWWADGEHILLGRILSEREARILLFPINNGRPRIISRGQLDLTATSDPTGSYIFFARGLPSRRRTNNLNIFEGFHIWRLKLSKALK